MVDIQKGYHMKIYFGTKKKNKEKILTEHVLRKTMPSWQYGKTLCQSSLDFILFFHILGIIQLLFYFIHHMFLISCIHNNFCSFFVYLFYTYFEYWMLTFDQCINDLSSQSSCLFMAPFSEILIPCILQKESGLLFGIKL